MKRDEATDMQKRLLATMLLVMACSPGDKGNGGPGPTAPASVASVTISPADVSLLVGTTRQLTAQTRDAGGNVLNGRVVTWSSSSDAIARIDANGLLSGVAAGSAQITATSEGRTNSITATVTQPVAASIVVTPNPATVTVALTTQLSASARDLSGAVLTGKTFAWTTSNANIAQVNGNGLVTGIAIGSATITASVDNVSGSATVNVAAAPSVVVSQITPATLVEGQAAIITGSGFSASPAANTVSIDGVSATVTSATATTLQVVVPSFDCRPRRGAPVRVTVGASSSAEVMQQVAPPSFVTLAVGQQTVVSGASPRCLQFDANSATERYVMGVQSISEVVATLTPVTVTAGVPSGSVTSDPLPIASRAPVPGLPAPSAIDLEDARRWQQHLSSTAASYARQIEYLQPLMRQRDVANATLQRQPPTVPGTVREGDQITIRFPNFNGNTCSQFSDLPVRVRKISAEAIILEDVANPVMLDQATVDQAAADFTTIYGIDVDQFGAPSDLDANQRIGIVITKEVNRVTSPPLGFVSYGNHFASTQCPASNEGEFFYMRAADPTGQFTAGVYAAATLTRDFTHLLAHELAHIIQASHRRALNGANFMASWMAEGLATGAQEVVGFQMAGLQHGQDYRRNIAYTTLGGDPRAFFGYVSDYIGYFGYDFNGNKIPNTPEECSWVGTTAAGGNPGPCTNAIRLLYGLPWSLIKYTIDRNLGGAANQRQYFRAFSDFVGPSGFGELQGVLGRSVTSMLPEWAAMLYIDNRYTAATAFQFANWNLRDIAGAWQSVNADLVPRSRAFAAFTDSFSVRAGSSAYYEISGTSRPATAVRVRDGSGNALPDFVVVWVVRVQ